MQDWKSHLIFALLLAIVWLSAVYFLDLFLLMTERIVLLVAVVMFTSLFPDIDLRKSKIRDWVSLIVSTIISVAYIFIYRDTWYYGLAYFLILYFLLRSIPSKHRGFTHSPKFAIVFSVIIALLIHFAFDLSQNEFIFWFAVAFSAYSLHLLLDKI